LAVGVGALLGLYTRIAAAGGALLALTFFLTVSWSTTPYYYGADIVFLFAWLTLLGFGDRGVLSLLAWLRDRARAGLGLRPEPATVAVSAERLHALCPRGAGCDLRRDGVCPRARGCPVFPLTEHLSPPTRAEIDRRTVVQTGTVAAAVAGGVALLAGLTAGVGRLVGGTDRQLELAALNGPAAPVTSSSAASPSGEAASSAAPPASSVPSSADPSTAQSTPASPAAATTSKRPKPARTSGARAGTAIGAASAVPLGQARSFTDPASGDPAWVVHSAASRFVAFDAVCTHAGCTVNYSASGAQFVCPCHGGVYDARTGEVLQGPPPAPLRRIPVQVVGGELRVDA
jgi:thiosulfate dehydrogenase [quinone] large subunit